MQASFWQQDWFVWGAIIIIGFPLLTLILGEIIYRARPEAKLLVATLRIVRNLILPAIAPIHVVKQNNWAVSRNYADAVGTDCTMVVYDSWFLNRS